MSRPEIPSAQDGRSSLNAHAAAKGAEIHDKYGPHIGWKELLKILADRACVRYPCEIVFDGGPLEPGEFAHPLPRGHRPEEGFALHVHPYFELQPDRLPYLVFYQLVLVNYGPFASPADAEVFGANALGISTGEYYQSLCAMADEIA